MFEVVVKIVVVVVFELELLGVVGGIVVVVVECVFEFERGGWVGFEKKLKVWEYGVCCRMGCGGVVVVYEEIGM